MTGANPEATEIRLAGVGVPNPSTVTQRYPNEGPTVPGVGFPILKNPRREYVVGGPWMAFAANGGFLLASVIDDVVRQFGPRVYELMVMDDAVDAALYLLKCATFAEGLQLRPACEAEPGEDLKKSKRGRRTDLKLAGQIFEFCQRGIEGLDRDINEELWQMADAMPFGCTIAEMVMDLAEDGPDRGKEVPTKLHVKPRWSYALRVNMFMELLAIRAWTVDGWCDIDRTKFAVLSWRPTNGDPRGTSILRPAYDAWNAKHQTYPDHREMVRHFADPSLVIKAGENQQTEQVTGSDGVVREVDPAQQNLHAGLEFKNRSILSLPYGADASLLQQTNGGQVYELAFDRWDRAIFRTILRSTRPFQEAKHGSKADTATGQDFFQQVVQATRKPFARVIRQDVLFRWVERNWGTSIAQRLTPHVGFGLSDDMTSEILTAFTQAWSGGVFQLPQRPWMLHKLGAPPDPEGYEPIQKGVTGVQTTDPKDRDGDGNNGGSSAGKPGANGGEPGQDGGTGDGGEQDKEGDDDGHNEEATDYG